MLIAIEFIAKGMFHYIGILIKLNGSTLIICWARFELQDEDQALCPEPEVWKLCPWENQALYGIYWRRNSLSDLSV